MIVVISVGGSVIAQGLSPDGFSQYADVIREIAEKNKVFVVVGGGSAARDYIGVARALGASEAVCDSIGIDITRLNARLLIAALGKDAYPRPPTSYAEADLAASPGRIVVMGGLSPGQTTDAVSAILAEFVNADLLVNATAVNGVYTADPRIDPNATKLDKITPTELVQIVVNTEMRAGSKSPIDPLAAKIIERSGIKTLVIDGRDPQNVKDAVEGRHEGTEITW